MKTNRSQPEQPRAAVGVAGVVRKPAVEQNAFLRAFQLEDDETPSAYRREMFDGRPHTVFPAVLAVEGVMNEALVTADELSKSAPAWNGRPIPMLHPEQLGEPISAAASPEVLERRIGTVFNAIVEQKKLKAELWIDEQRVDHLGASDVLSAMLNGDIVEISTGYFSDDVLEQSEYQGEPYQVRHINLRPDHLALLPGQVGACSIADGCGVPRTNQSRGLGVKVREALSVLSKALGGVHANDCDCQECTMKTREQKLEQAKKDFKELKLHANEKFIAAVNSALGLGDDKALKANKALESKHLKMLEGLDDDQLGMMSAMIEAYRAQGASNQEPGDGDDPEDPDAAAAAAAANGDDPAAQAKQNRRGKPKEDEPVQLTQKQLDELIANRVKSEVAKQVPEQNRRADVTAKLKANERNPFTDEELNTLPVEALEKTETALRPADYTGGAGFAVHSELETDNAEPPHVIANKRLEERRKARDGKAA